MTIIHAENVLLENIYVNSTDLEHPVDFDFSSLNVRTPKLQQSIGRNGRILIRIPD